MSNIYSPLKIFHHRKTIDQLRRGEQVVPLQVQLVISDFCNLNCSFCAYRTDGYASNEMFGVNAENGIRNNNPNRMITYEKVIEILNDLVDMGVKAVQFTGGGEPTVHPQFNQILETALDLGLDVGVVTNGVKMDQDTIKLLMRAHWVRISLDAHHAQTYGDIKGVPSSKLSRVESNLRKLLHRKVTTGSQLVIGVGFVVTKENWREVCLFSNAMKNLGVDNVRLSAVFQPDGAEYFKDFYAEAAELCKNAKQEECKGFRVFNLFGDRVADLETKSPDYSFCAYQQLVSYIGADLNVYRCCGYAYNHRGLIGSIANQPFKSFWYSDEKIAKIGSFNATTCERCQFNAKNKTVLYAMTEDPGHVNFV